VKEKIGKAGGANCRDFHTPSLVVRHIAPVDFQLRSSSAASAADQQLFDIRMQPAAETWPSSSV